MKISQLGGEFQLINRLTSARGGSASSGKKTNNPNLIKGIGDDCAVFKYTKTKHLLLTTDMMVEGSHFNTKWQTPKQIGMKLMEINVSDIVSMGGAPKYAVISLSIKKNTTVKFIDELYKGLYQSAKKHNVLIIGGDTTQGKEYVFNLALVGEVKKSLLRLRSHAKVGDLICVTGKLGGSTAGLKLLEKSSIAGKPQLAVIRTGKLGLAGYCKKHLEPKSRTAKEAQIIAKYAHAMIDVSDGLGSEVKHICNESNVGARIDYDKIPLFNCRDEALPRVGGRHEAMPRLYNYALYGGEDFELVFTIQKQNLKKLKTKFKDFTVVGEILDKKAGAYILKNNKKQKIKSGYDHFK